MKTERADRGPIAATDSTLARSAMAHPLRAFVVGAFACSWIWWLAAPAGPTLDSIAVDVTILGILLAGTLALIAMARGRLGAEPTSARIT